jgi:hypothetical protein
MNADTRQKMEDMVASWRSWVKEILGAAEGVADRPAAASLEDRIRREGQRLLGQVLTAAMQLAVDAQPEARTCPHCGGARRHKGQRRRTPLSSLGALRLEGVYWYCPRCGQGEHAADAVIGRSFSEVLRELLCLLAVGLVSFERASQAATKVLGVRVDDETLRRLTHREGERVKAAPLSAPLVPPQTDLVASCDGTMVHIREDGWRELKAYLFTHEAGRLGGAHLEEAEQFTPRLRQAALALRAGQARRVFAVSDAAEWIDRGFRIQWPMAIRIVDLWHACQHVQAAGQFLYPKDEAQGRRWGRSWSTRLRQQGGAKVLAALSHRRGKPAAWHQALAPLRRYLANQADRLDYPTYEALGYPISSGSMESRCKQLGRRLKGPGMRWSRPNVDPMAALVSVWADNRWDRYWHPTVPTPQT